MESIYHLCGAQRMLGPNSVRILEHSPRAHAKILKRRYIFFPETANLSLEDVDHLFEKGGITGGVWGAPGGRTVAAHSDRLAGPDALEAHNDEEKNRQGEIQYVERN